MKTELAGLAQSLGFDIFRVVKCTFPPHAEAFHAWLGEGRAGEMEWLARNKERRTDPQQVLPGAQSIIVLGMNYFQGEEPANTPRIARYAWGEDYHDIIEKKLRTLDEFLRGHGGVQKCYVDTGPVLERDFAAQAGAGWHGKSTMLINRKFGTWFFLAEILTTLELDEDAPEKDHCGSCTRCIDACPTGAITAPHQLDARKCVSYLTIELKGSIPLELRPLIGDRIYGCDDCLTACPWNRFAKTSNEVAYTMSKELARMSLLDFLQLKDEGFRMLFRKSPVKRIKRRGFVRNVCVALGNTGTPGDIPALEKAVLDPEPLISEHALWAIGRIRERHAETLTAPATP